MIQDQADRFAQAGQTFFARLTLAVGSGDFGAIGDEPWAVLLKQSR